MKKRVLIVTLCIMLVLFGLTGCDSDKTLSHNQYITMDVVENVQNGEILVDRETGVLYFLYRCLCVNGDTSQTITPLYNTDGSLKNIADFQSGDN